MPDIHIVGYPANYGNVKIIQWNQRHCKLDKITRAGVDYLRNYAEFLARCPDYAVCLAGLDWIRWKEGFACPTYNDQGWRLKTENGGAMRAAITSLFGYLRPVSSLGGLYRNRLDTPPHFQ